MLSIRSLRSEHSGELSEHRKSPPHTLPKGGECLRKRTNCRSKHRTIYLLIVPPIGTNCPNRWDIQKAVFPTVPNSIPDSTKQHSRQYQTAFPTVLNSIPDASSAVLTPLPLGGAGGGLLVVGLSMFTMFTMFTAMFTLQISDTQYVVKK